MICVHLEKNTFVANDIGDLDFYNRTIQPEVYTYFYYVTVQGHLRGTWSPTILPIVHFTVVSEVSFTSNFTTAT